MSTIKYGRPQPPQVALKRRYTPAQFIANLTDDEWGILEETAQLNTAVGRRAKRLLAYWREGGVDFNDPITQAAIQFLVNNTSEWTQARADELAG